MFVFETNLRGDLSSAQTPNDAVKDASTRDDTWSGLYVNQTLGQLMTQTRKHLGLSREQVASQTNIPAYYVRMIESDSYDAIPDQLYLLPFFRRYAEFLGLDAQKVVSRFILDFEKAENQVAETPTPTAYAKALLKWRQIATATVLGAILLPCIAWGIGSNARRISPARLEFTGRAQLFRKAAINSDHVDRCEFSGGTGYCTSSRSTGSDASCCADCYR